MRCNAFRDPLLQVRSERLQRRLDRTPMRDILHGGDHVQGPAIGVMGDIHVVDDPNVALVSSDQTGLDAEWLAGLQHLRVPSPVLAPILRVRQLVQRERAQVFRAVAYEAAVALVHTQDLSAQVCLHQADRGAADDGAKLLAGHAQRCLGLPQRLFQPASVPPSE
jgi:hypothetical protein